MPQKKLLVTLKITTFQHLNLPQMVSESIKSATKEVLLDPKICHKYISVLNMPKSGVLHLPQKLYTIIQS